MNNECLSIVPTHAGAGAAWAAGVPPGHNAGRAGRHGGSPHPTA